MLQWNEDPEQAFEEFKTALVNIILLAHPDEKCRIVLCMFASSTAMSVALHQIRNNEIKPLAFFSRKFLANEMKYPTYDSELLVMYAGVYYFRKQLEGRIFTIYTDHKPLSTALEKRGNNDIPCRAHQLDYIAQFT